MIHWMVSIDRSFGTGHYLFPAEPEHVVKPCLYEEACLSTPTRVSKNKEEEEACLSTPTRVSKNKEFISSRTLCYAVWCGYHFHHMRNRREAPLHKRFFERRHEKPNATPNFLANSAGDQPSKARLRRNRTCAPSQYRCRYRCRESPTADLFANCQTNTPPDRQGEILSILVLEKNGPHAHCPVVLTSSVAFAVGV
jgi:hypothetical protein